MGVIASGPPETPGPPPAAPGGPGTPPGAAGGPRAPWRGVALETVFVHCRRRRSAVARGGRGLGLADQLGQQDLPEEQVGLQAQAPRHTGTQPTQCTLVVLVLVILIPVH